MDWRYEYVDLEKIRELMEKTDSWEESRQQEFYGYLLEKKDEFFRSEFGDLFLHMYKEKLGVPDLEIIRQKKPKQPEQVPQSSRSWFWRALPVLFLAVAVSAGSIWVYRKAEGQNARRHLESLQKTVQQGEGAKSGRAESMDASGQTAGGGDGPKQAPPARDADAGEQNQAGQSGGVGEQSQTGQSGGAGEQSRAGQNGGAGERTQTDGGKGLQSRTDKNSGAQEKPPVLEQYRELSKQYPELFGWLMIPDTGINYPVMQSRTQKDYFLHHNYEGTASDEGALFVDPLSSSYPMDDNTVIYGHNMKNGHMFGELKNYGVESYFQKNREIFFHTLYETGTYEVVTVLQTHIRDEAEDGFRYYQFFNYETEEEFQECVNFIQENQIYDVKNKLQYGDKLLMLSTCDYVQDNGRFVVVARKKEK